MQNSRSVSMLSRLVSQSNIYPLSPFSMQRSRLNNITRILLWVIIGGVSLVWAVYAVGTYLEWWRTTGVANQDIADNTNTCRRITSWPANYFIPSRTATEWNAFNTVAASKGFTITSCGIPVVNWVCGGGANTCTAWSPSGYSAGACGGSRTWSCLGSGGGSNASCSLANPGCAYNISGIGWDSWPYTIACNAGSTIVSGSPGCQYPGNHGWLGYIGAYVVQSNVAWNGWTVDCRVSQSIWPAGCEDFTWWYGDPPDDQCWYGYPRDRDAGAATLTITCQPY